MQVLVPKDVEAFADPRPDKVRQLPVESAPSLTSFDAWVAVLACIFFITGAILQRGLQGVPAFTSWSLGMLTMLSWAWGRRGRLSHINTRHLVLAIGLAALAFVLRTWRIRTLPGFIDRDDIYIAQMAAALANDLTGLLNIFWVGISIFVIYPQAVLFRLFDSSIVNLRLAQAIQGSLEVFALFYLGRSLVNVRVGVAAAILLAVSHTSINYSRIGSGYIETALYGVVMMAFAVRAWRGGSLANLVGAAIALGLGLMSYQASYILPVLLIASSAPFLVFYRKNKDAARVFFSVIFITAIGLCIASPPFAMMTRQVDWEGSRPAVLLITPAKIGMLASWYGMPSDPPFAVIMRHIKEAFGVFWFGKDPQAVYGAEYPLLDLVTGICLALSPLLFIVRRVTLGWICLVWCVSYIFFGTVLCAQAVTYHRILVVIPFASLAAAGVIDALLPAFFSRLVLTGVCCGAAYLNLTWYFRDYPAKRPVFMDTKLSQIMCQYSKTHTIIDASAPADSPGWGDSFRELLKIDCGNVNVKQIPGGRDLWNPAAFTAEKHLVIAQTKFIDELGIHPPSGYTVDRVWTDSSVRWPMLLPLTMIEISALNGSKQAR